MFENVEQETVEQPQESVTEATAPQEGHEQQPDQQSVEGQQVEQHEEVVEPEEQQEEELNFLMPGQRGYDETEFLRNQYQNLARQNAEMRRRIEEAELAGLDENEREAVQAQRELEAMRAQLRQIQQREEVNQWREYYAQFVPAEVAQTLAEVQDPVQMMHQSFQTLKQSEIALQRQVQQLQRELEAAKSATATPEPGPAVTTGGGGQPSRRSILNMTPQEREQYYQKRASGLYDPNQL